MKITIGKKLYSGFGAVLSLLIIIAVLNSYQMRQIEQIYQELMNNQVSSVSLVKDLTVAVLDENVQISSFLQNGNQAAIDGYRKAVANYNALSDQLKPIISDKDTWQILMGLDLLQQEYTSNMEQVIELKQSNQEEAVLTLLETSQPIIDKFIETAGRFVAIQENELVTGLEESEQQASRTYSFIITLTIIATIVGLAVAFVISRMITKPVQLLSKAAEQISSGDLTNEKINIRSRDEIGTLANSFNKMSENLKHLITQLSVSAEHVAASSQQLTAGAEHTSQATEQVVEITEKVSVGAQAQMDNVKEGLHLVNQVSNEAIHIVDYTQEVSEKAAYAANVSDEGSIAVRTVIARMNEIEHTIENIEQEVKKLGERSSEIGLIVQAITDISEQTNLLALNAAIEAARAGEAGRGFAVVAAEVKKLADQSTQSSKAIANLVNTIQADTKTTVSAVQSGVLVVQSGRSAVELAGSSFHQIQDAVSAVSEQMHTVSAASQNMSDNTKTLVANISAIQKIADETSEGTITVSAATEEQLSTMEQIASSCTNLTKMSEELLELVNAFKV